MTQNRIKELLNQGYKLELWLKPTKKHDKLTFKTMLINRETGYVHFLNYHHAKKFLASEQIRLKELWDTVKSMQYRDWVDINIRKNRNKATKSDMEMLVMNKAIKSISSLELV